MKVFEGIGASDGIAEGPAHWVRSAEDLEQFEPGAVLVAQMTSPDWGSAYQNAAAVVTMEGGMLCHAAIVAREEGIPAVVGLGSDLGLVKDGVRVRVDGSAGLVILAATD
ncbi:PEP-utilizing enzyme [Catellatospora citrea]|uniref:PEP-utilizing enzyme n=1 Tax=Catellatospora citrea TaxID=53366 RepID=UPI0033E5A09A